MNDLYTYPYSQPLKLARITSPKSPPDQLSQRTRKRRIHEVQNIRSIIGVNSKGSELILGDEIRVLSVEKKQELLHSAGVQIEMLPMQGLAIKSMLAIPWYRLRILRRYIGYIGVHRILHVCV